MSSPVNPINPNSKYSPFLPTTFDFPKEDDQIGYYITDNLSRFADVINDKTIGAFTQAAESLNGEKWSYDTTRKARNGFQAIARIPSFIDQTIDLPISKVNEQFVITLVYGSASLPCTAIGAGDGDYFSFFSNGDPRIQFTMSDTQIIIVTDGLRANYQGYIIIQYLRDGT